MYGRGATNAGMFDTGVVLVAAVLAWVYWAIHPPAPRLCGSKIGPSVTSPRVRLSDGWHLAYKESGVPKDKSIYTVVLTHGFDSSKDLYIPIPQMIIINQ